MLGLLLVSVGTVMVTGKFCPILNQDNVLVAGLRGGGDQCNHANANVPTDGCVSSKSATGIEELFSAAMIREEEFGRLTYQYITAVESGQLGVLPWYDPKAQFTPPTDRCDVVQLINNCAAATGQPYGQSYSTLQTIQAAATTTYYNDNYKKIRTWTKTEIETIRREVRTLKAEPHPWQSTIATLCPDVTFNNQILMPGSPDSYETGRCYGEPFSHQRFWEFFPRRLVKTIQTGAQVNSGIRDELQRHKYMNGEFAVLNGGLYKNTGEGDGYTKGMKPAVHPALNQQDQQSVWTFDGTVPPKLLIARYGEPILLRHYNGLPLSYDCNRGFGSHFISTHEHNGHNPAESDGFANGYLLPGQFYDYRWPMILAGHDSINTDAQDIYASTPCTPLNRVGTGYQSSSLASDWDDNGQMVIAYPGDCKVFDGRLTCYSQTTTASVACAGGTSDLSCCAIGDPSLSEQSQCCSDDGSWCFMNQGMGDQGKPWHRLVMACPDSGTIKISGDYRETMSTHWFHDHMIDHTSQNVYKGNAAMTIYYSGIDRGNECWDDGINLRLPSGCGMKYNIPDTVVGGLPNEGSWGLRDYDVYMVLGSKAWGQDTKGYFGGNLCNQTTTGSAVCKDQLWMNKFNTDGFVGDKMLLNWVYKPYFAVRPRRYRLRFLNGDVSRFMKLALVEEFLCTDPSYDPVALKNNNNYFEGKPGENKCYRRVPFHLIANDGNIMPYAVPFDGTMNLYPEVNGGSDVSSNNPAYAQSVNTDGCNRFLGITPTFSIAERMDLIVDFSEFAPGKTLFVVNIMDHADGRRPRFPDNIQGGINMLRNILDGSYSGGDGAAAKILRLDVVAGVTGAVDNSMNPKDYEPPCVLNGIDRCICTKTTPADVLRRLTGKTMIVSADHSKVPVTRSRLIEFKRGGAVMPTEATLGLNLYAIGEDREAELPNNHNKEMEKIMEQVSVDEEEVHYVNANIYTPNNGCVGTACIETPWSIRTANRRHLEGKERMEAINKHLNKQENMGVKVTTIDHTVKNNLRSLQAQVVNSPSFVTLPAGVAYKADMHFTSLAPEIETMERWHFNGGGGWNHNVHTHFEEGHIISRDGHAPPMWEQGARKDVYRVGPGEDSGLNLELTIRFRDFAGEFMTHCHNTVHEDKSMLQRWDIENPGQLKPFLEPTQTWQGCTYQATMEMAGAAQNSFGSQPAQAITTFVTQPATGGINSFAPAGTKAPTPVPVAVPTALPTAPTVAPTAVPNVAPTAVPTRVPTIAVGRLKSRPPTASPIVRTRPPTNPPTRRPTKAPIARVGNTFASEGGSSSSSSTTLGVNAIILISVFGGLSVFICLCGYFIHRRCRKANTENTQPMESNIMSQI